MQKEKKVSTVSRPRYKVLASISFSHFLNDTMQSLILAVYPMLKADFHLSFVQIGLITLSYQITASLLQPIVGIYTDKRPKPFSLVWGMTCTLSGILMLAFAGSYPYLLMAAMMVGMGSSIFHPEAARVSRIASEGQFGLAQSIFQVGGNIGAATGPLLAAWIVIPHTRTSISWFSPIAFLAMIVLLQVGFWYRRQLPSFRKAQQNTSQESHFSHRKIVQTILLLLVLIFSKYFYMSSLNSYYMFYLIHKFHVSMHQAQYMLFLFLFSVAVGTLIGGPIGDRIGRKRVIWFSILGVAPFTLILPYANLFWTGILTIIIGLILASAFPAILVFAQELVPGKFGMISGLFYGFSFGMGGLGAAVLGELADLWGIDTVYSLCAFLPLLGILAVFLPNISDNILKKKE
ncbi:MAG: MFS transporter [Candidatus Azobacteroides sp.]|nr:MFS transporter [Candidatus Azobacteroides sp.]